MPPHELAESMQALRMATKLRQSPRTRSTCTEEYMAYDPTLRPTNSNNEGKPSRNGDKHLKEKIRKTLPVEASEMARIASIFSLKSQSK